MARTSELRQHPRSRSHSPVSYTKRASSKASTSPLHSNSASITRSSCAPLLEPGMRTARSCRIWITGSHRRFRGQQTLLRPGTMVQTAISSCRRNLRVAVVANGSISGDIGGPRGAAITSRLRRPMAGGCTRCSAACPARRSERALDERPPSELPPAGNVSGELPELDPRCSPSWGTSAGLFSRPSSRRAFPRTLRALRTGNERPSAVVESAG